MDRKQQRASYPILQIKWCITLSELRRGGFGQFAKIATLEDWQLAVTGELAVLLTRVRQQIGIIWSFSRYSSFYFSPLWKLCRCYKTYILCEIIYKNQLWELKAECVSAESLVWWWDEVERARRCVQDKPARLIIRFDKLNQSTNSETAMPCASVNISVSGCCAPLHSTRGRQKWDVELQFLEINDWSLAFRAQRVFSTWGWINIPNVLNIGRSFILL